MHLWRGRYSHAGAPDTWIRRTKDERGKAGANCYPMMMIALDPLHLIEAVVIRGHPRIIHLVEADSHGILCPGLCCGCQGGAQGGKHQKSVLLCERVFFLSASPRRAACAEKEAADSDRAYRT